MRAQPRQMPSAQLALRRVLEPVSHLSGDEIPDPPPGSRRLSLTFKLVALQLSTAALRGLDAGLKQSGQRRTPHNMAQQFEHVADNHCEKMRGLHT